MGKGRHAFRGLILATLATVLSAGGGAQASPPAELITPGTYSINLGPALLASVIMTQIGSGSLLIPSLETKVECQEIVTYMGEISTSTDAQVQVEFSKCLLWLSGKHQSCEFKTGGFVMEALVLPILFGGELPLLLFEPLEGKFALIVLSFQPETGCPLPLNSSVSGSIIARIETEGLEAATQLITFTESFQEATGELMRYGTRPAYINSHAELNLIGEHEWQKLGIH